MQKQIRSDRQEVMPPGLRQSVLLPARDGWLRDAAQARDFRLPAERFNDSLRVLDSDGFVVHGRDYRHTDSRLSIGIPKLAGYRLPIMERWAERIEERRRELGLSQVKLAKAIGITQPSVNDWLSGRTRMIDGQNLVLAAQALKTTPEWIMQGRGQKDVSQAPGLDLDLLKSAIVSVKEALRQRDLELEAFVAAPMIAYAYRERAKLPRTLTKAEYADFDAAILSKLSEELGDARRRPAAGGSEESPKAVPTKRSKAGDRGR